MIILGINSNLLHDCGAALVKDGTLLAAVNEERLTRIKQQRGMPFLSVKEVLKISQVNPGNIDRIHIVGFPPLWQALAFLKTVLRISWVLKLSVYKVVLSNNFQTIISRRLGPNGRESSNLLVAAISNIYQTKRLINSLKSQGFKGEIKYIPHHLCHIYAAYSASGIKEKCLIINIEGSSFEYTTNIFLGIDGQLSEISSTKDPSSAGHFYACFTEILGFIPGFHEGKVTGLSAWGRVLSKKKTRPLSKLLLNISELIKVDHLKFKISPKVFLWPLSYSLNNKKLPMEITGFKKEEIAWAAQKRLEDIVCELIKTAIKKTNCKKIILTGGVAANVRMNQAIHQLKEVKKLYIYPAMGDFGNAHGAAIAPITTQKIPLKKLTDLYLGPSYTDSYIHKVIESYNLKYKVVDSKLLNWLSLQLTKDKIVCLFQGRMEYGPRALGHRSIIAAAKNKSVVKRLNSSLKRDDFMPFAPVVLDQYKDLCFENIKGAEFSGEFMTITFKAKAFLRKNCPGVVHVDGTARPQFLKKSDSSIYSIQERYYKLTGIPVLINTSFNMHDEPIVCTPEDAVKAFLESGLDYLVLEKFLIKK